MKIIKYHAYVKQTTEIINIILAPLAWGLKILMHETLPY